MQRCVPGATQGVATSVCHEEVAQEQSGASQPGRPSVRRARHSDIHRQSVCRQLLLQLWNKGRCPLPLDVTFTQYWFCLRSRSKKQDIQAQSSIWYLESWHAYSFNGRCWGAILRHPFFHMHNKNSNNSKFQKTFKHLLNYKLWVPTYKTLLLLTTFIVSSLVRNWWDGCGLVNEYST